MKPTLFCLALVTGLLAAEPIFIPNISPDPAAKPDPLNAARWAVQTTIVPRLQPSIPPFSRSMPQQATPTYQLVERVGNEDRLPFTVVSLQRSLIKQTPLQPIVTGYVRLSDNAIFIFRPETNDYIPSTLDPRFAPAKEGRIEPVKPT